MRRLFFIIPVCLLVLALGTLVEAGIRVQCPPGAKCMHLVGADGYVSMADGYRQYVFGFLDMTGVPVEQVLLQAELGANSPAPPIRLKEGEDFYLTLSTAPMKMRPDLFDAHSVHWHGMPNIAPIFDGEPMASIGANPGASFTYYYKVPAPGTYAYHCHVEATEHMQMGMLGHLTVTPKQDGTLLNGFTKFAYNDGDGSTGYDVDFDLTVIGFDPNFHDANGNPTPQPLPFADMKDTYMQINGRGYPDTINTGFLAPPILPDGTAGKQSQKVNALIEAVQGQRILLRIMNLNTVHFTTLTIPGITMKVVGKDAQLLRGSDGTNLYYNTNTFTSGGGQSADIILETAGVPKGTYFLYTTNHSELSNNTQDFGGLMTEIVIK